MVQRFSFIQLLNLCYSGGSRGELELHFAVAFVSLLLVDLYIERQTERERERERERENDGKLEKEIQTVRKKDGKLERER